MLAEIEVAAAAVHTVGTAFGPRRIAGLLRVIRTVIVEHPFGDVAVGVVEAESVGLQLIHGDGLPAVAAGAHRRILLIHVVLFYKIGIGTLEVDVIAGNLIANVENGLRAGADRVLPLRFGEQTVAACLSVPGNGLTCDRVHGFEPFLHAQGVAVLHGGKPGHVFHWQAFSSVGTGIAAHDSLIVFLRHLIRINEKGADAHSVQHFVGLAQAFRIGAAHLEFRAGQKEKAIGCSRRRSGSGSGQDEETENEERSDMCRKS